MVFIHGALIADTFLPLLAEPSLAGQYRLILYHRQGYAGSSRASGLFSIAQQAADCRAVLRHLGVERAHVVGHSYGGAVALQLALDTPGIAHSLALLEPALMAGTSAEGYRDSLSRGIERYRKAGAAVVVDEFLQGRWPGYRVALDHELPGAFAQAVEDAGTSFEFELPGLLGWQFGEAEARRINSLRCRCWAAKVKLSGLVSARRTGYYWHGCRTPKEPFSPARHTSCRSKTREPWPRCLRPSGHATKLPLEGRFRGRAVVPPTWSGLRFLATSGHREARKGKRGPPTAGGPRAPG